MDAKAQHQIQLASPASSGRWVSPERRATQAFVGVTAGHHHRRGERHRLPGNVLRLQGSPAPRDDLPPAAGRWGTSTATKAHFIPP
ncbi:hypothetical protein LNO81_14605 [Klebsiella variicola subsp. variicola]|nr:hypothetical protein [Klebsiella variicola subsp. variicola]